MAHNEQLEGLENRIRGAEYVTAELLTSIVNGASRRLLMPSQTANSARLAKFVSDGAFTEAMLLLIELELPQLKLRRITYDEGEWHCALSRQRELPDWLDQAIEARHPDFTLAIAGAFIEALRTIEPLRGASRSSVPAFRSERFETLSCENFS